MLDNAIGLELFLSAKLPHLSVINIYFKAYQMIDAIFEKSLIHLRTPSASVQLKCHYSIRIIAKKNCFKIKIKYTPNCNIFEKKLGVVGSVCPSP